ncbi:MAG: outer membrane protein assembly factor BamA, partial [Spirochaetaceae bacterium]|nr:outer membrane protein assembly factor BamA [Spirochaetaceae bacterium]
MCKCVGKTIILFLLFSVSLGFSQESSGWYYDKPIRNIRFEGLDTIRSFDLDGIKNQFIGKNFSDEVYLDLINRLYALDYFDDISPEVFPVDEKRNSLALVFTVKEKPVIKEINYSGNKKIKLTELKNTVTIKTGDIFNEAKMRVDERAIFNLYLQKGYTNVKVVATSSSVDGGVAVNFTVTEGKSTVLTEINFQGNTLISSKTLSGILEMKPEGKLFSSGHFQEATLESDKTKIIGYYFERGYIDAKIIDVIRTTSHNEAKDREDLAITFVIEEGEMYTYGGLTIVGNEIFSSELLASKVKLQ